MTEIAHFTTADGKLFEGPPQDVAAYVAATPGAAAVTADQAAEIGRVAGIREEERGTIGAIKSGVAGLVQGATTLPLLEGAEVAFGRVFGGEEGQREAQERLRIRGEEQAAANLAGQAVGFGAAAMASGGTSLVARAATGGARLTMAAGERAAAFAAERMAKDAIKTKLVSAGLRGAAEGTILAAGGVVKEATLGTDITTELVATRLAEGLVLGGAGNALFAGLGVAGGAAAAKIGAGTVGGLVGGVLGGAAAGPVGAVAGAVTGGAIGKIVGKGAAAGERAILESARVEAERLNTGSKALTGDLTPDELKNLISTRAADAAAEVEIAATAMPGESLEMGEERMRRGALAQELSDNAASDRAYGQEVQQNELLKKMRASLEDPNSALAAQTRAVALEAEGKLKGVADSMGNYKSGTLADVNEGASASHTMVTGEKKYATMTRLAKETDGAEYLASSAKVRIAEEIRALAEAVQERMGSAGEHFTGRKAIDNQLAQLERQASELAHLPDSAEGLAAAHRIGDITKRDFDKMAASLTDPRSLAARGADERQFLISLTEASPANKLRAALENADVFGDRIAGTQIAINDAWRDVIPSLKKFSRNFTREGLEYSERDPFRMKDIIDDRKFYTFITGDLSLGGNDSRIDDVAKYIASQHKFQETALRLFGADADAKLVARATRGTEQAWKAKGQFASAREHAAAAAAAKELSSGAVEQLTINALGSVPLVGKAIATLVELQARATLERATAKLVGDADARIAKAVAAFVQGAQKPGQFVAEVATQAGRIAAVPEAAPAKRVDEIVAVPKTATRAGMASEAIKQMAIIGNVAGTPDAIANFAYASAQPLHFDGNDRLSISVANASARAVAFLAAKRVPVRDGDTTQPQFAVQQLTDAQVSSWRSYVATATNPLSVLDDLQKGTVTREQSETLRALYPSIYTAIQTRVLDALHDARRPISYAQRITLYTLFGATTDPTLSPAFVQAVQAGFSSAKTPTPQGLPKPIVGAFSKGVSSERLGRSNSSR